MSFQTFRHSALKLAFGLLLTTHGFEGSLSAATFTDPDPGVRANAIFMPADAPMSTLLV